VLVTVIEVSLNREREQKWINLPHKRALVIAVCPVLLVSNRQGLGKIRKLNELAVDALHE
jgi:hypothetical protein